MNEKTNLTIEEKFSLGLKNHKNNNLQEAKNFYNETLKINPNHIDANNNLGIVFFRLKEYQKAMNCYEKIIQINPNNVDAHNNLGIVLHQLREYQKAMNCYEKVIEIQPNYAAAFYNCGNTLKELGKYQKAIGYYEKAIEIQPNYVDAHNNLGIVLHQLREYQKAISCYEKVIEIQFNYVGAHNNLGNIYKELGDHQKAISCYEKVIQIEPNNLTSHWFLMNIFPIIYKDLKEIDHYRKKFDNSINKINYLLDTQPKYTKKHLVDAINSSTNFYLHYQGRDDFELQQRYANLIERITQKIYQDFHKERKKNISSPKIKIGFVSSFFRNHTVSKLFKNWTLKLDKKYFKKFVYYVDNKFDNITEKIKHNVDYFFSHTDVDQLINQISEDNLDVLIYLDIGMRPKIQILSSLRLATIQCNTWGHPVTSGFKNIDYYFSGELMESQNSQKYYSEKLITLPGLGIDYDLPNLSNIKKPNISKKSDATIFLNLQSLFKLLPQDDHIYLDIIKKHSNCYFWFFDGVKDSITYTFKKRISELFQKEGYNFEKYSYFHQRCSQEEFFGIIEASDIILDSLNWSGGNTSLEAISLDKPIVTYPSTFMRGRHTYGILKILDIEETIAISKKNYVEIAVKLATDKNFRNSLVDKIKKNKNKLFNDDKPLKFLEEVIRKKLI